MITNRVFAAALTATTFIAGSGVAASAELPRHVEKGDKLAVEHAEIVLAPLGGTAMTGYLVLWNGSLRQAAVAAVVSPAFRSVSFFRTEGFGDAARLRPMPEGVTIPGHADLVMKSNGVRLRLTGPQADLRLGDRVNLRLLLSDGSTLETIATIAPAGSQPMDHHHGALDRQETQ